MLYIYIYTYTYSIYIFPQKNHATHVQREHHVASISKAIHAPFWRVPCFQRVNCPAPWTPMHQSAPLPGSALAAATPRRLHLNFSCFLVAPYGFQLPAVPLTQRARSSKHSGWLHANFVHAPTAVPAQLLCAFLHLRTSWSREKTEIRKLLGPESSH